MFDRLRIYRFRANARQEQSIFRQPLQPSDRRGLQGNNFSSFGSDLKERAGSEQFIPLMRLPGANNVRQLPFAHSFGSAPVHLQAKLAISQPDDPAEQEADRMADQVMRSPMSSVSSPGIHQPLQNFVQRKCAACAAEEHQHQSPAADSPFAQVQRVVGSGGQSLDAETQSFMQPRFGFDFSQVRIHADAQASQSAESVNAQAYTVGHHIVFRSGQYAPETDAGKRLLAHELTHVVQQQGGQREVQRVCAACEEEQIMRQTDGAASSPGLDMTPRDGIEPGSAQVETSSLDVELSALLPPASAGTDAGMNVPGAAPENGAPEQQLPTGGAAAKASRILAQALTWADFKGSPSGSHAAETAYEIKLEVAEGVASLAAIFNGSKSWVKPEFKNPTSLSDSRCDKAIDNCQDWFAKHPDGTWGPLEKDVTDCAASIPYHPSTIASSRSQCYSVVGSECTRTAELESVRLLSHEQTHFDLGCVIAGKGTAALNAAPPGDQQNVLNRVKRAVNDQEKKYDSDTKSGCDSSAQSRWQSDVKSGLGSVRI